MKSPLAGRSANQAKGDSTQKIDDAQDQTVKPGSLKTADDAENELGAKQGDRGEMPVLSFLSEVKDLKGQEYSDSFKAVLQQQIKEVLMNQPGGAEMLVNLIDKKIESKSNDSGKAKQPEQVQIKMPEDFDSVDANKNT